MTQLAALMACSTLPKTSGRKNDFMREAHQLRALERTTSPSTWYPIGHNQQFGMVAMLVGLAVTLIGCSSSSPSQKNDTESLAQIGMAQDRAAIVEPDLAAVDYCLEGLYVASSMPADLRWQIVGEACGGACEDFPKIASASRASFHTQVAEISRDRYLRGDPDQAYRCAYACPATGDEFLMEPTQPFSFALGRACGLARYGLTEGQEAFLSPEWFILQRVSAWLSDLRPRLDSQRRARLDGVSLHFELPLPALPGLPSGNAIASLRPTQIAWLFNGELWVSPAPSATLKGASLTLEATFSKAEVSVLSRPNTALAVSADTPISEIEAYLGDAASTLGLYIQGKFGAYGVTTKPLSAVAWRTLNGMQEVAHALETTGGEGFGSLGDSSAPPQTSTGTGGFSNGGYSLPNGESLGGGQGMRHRNNKKK